MGKFLKWNHLLLLSLLALSIRSGSSQQPLDFGKAPLGIPGEQVPVSVMLPNGGQVSRVSVLTDGAEQLDFQLADESCTKYPAFFPNQSCVVDVTFRPSRPGKRNGIILLLSASGEPLGARPLAATAIGPNANFISGQIKTVAGNSSFLFSGDGGPATSASLFLPFGMTLDGAGNLYIADTYNQRIRRVDQASGKIQTIAGDGTAGFSGDGGPGTSARLNQPSSVALDVAGNLYIADTANDVVRVLNAQTGIISTIAGTAGAAGYAGDGALAIQAELQSPNGLTLDSTGNLYIADTANNVIRKVAFASGIITTFAGTGAAGHTGDGRAATACTFNAPWGLAFDTAGNLAIADQKSNVIRQINTSGIITTVAGNGSAGFSGDNGQALGANLNQPSNLAYDAAGNLYIADTGNNRIRKINPATHVISTVAGDNSTSLQGDGFPANNSALYGPYAIAVDANADIFIADVFHNRIREVPSNVAILIYPTLRVNTASGTQNQIIENDGTSALDLSAIMNVSDGLIQPSTTCSTNTPLQPLAQCVLAVQFSSPTVGTPVMGSIQIQSNGNNAPNTLLLQANVTSTSASTVILSSTPDPSIVGNPVTFTVQVVSMVGVATGTVNLLDGTSTIGSLTLTNGLATVVLSNLSIGQHTITAAYSGDANNAAATSLPVLQVVTAVPVNSGTTTTVTTSANPVTVGQALTISATVAPVAGTQATPTGTITFLDGTSQLGVATLSSGTASLSVLSLAAGTHCLKAVYSGDTLYAATTSACFTEVVTTTAPPINTTQFTLTVTPVTLSLSRGSHATLQVGIVPEQTFSDTLSFGCGGLPAYASCVFSQQNVAVAGGVKQSVSFVFDTAAPLGSGSVASRQTSIKSIFEAGISLGALCLIGFTRRSRRNLKLFSLSLSLFALLLLSGCGSISKKETPAGSYTIQVFASGATTGASSYTSVPITVTP